MPPGRIADFVPRELNLMLDGMAWASDREWERAIYQRLSVRDANEMSKNVYPAFQLRSSEPEERVLYVKRGRREGPVPGRSTFSGS